MARLLAGVWHRLRGTLQWYLLWLIHHKFVVGVSGVVLDDQQRVLLLQHRFWRPGSWGLPSGYANRGEHLEDTLRREVHEETGYHIEVTDLIRMVSGYKLRLEVSYLGRITGGQRSLDQREILNASFFPVDALPDGLLRSHRDIIRTALEK